MANSRESTRRNLLDNRRHVLLAALLGGLMAEPASVKPDLQKSELPPMATTSVPSAEEISLDIKRAGEGEQVVEEYIRNVIRDKRLPYTINEVTQLQPDTDAYIELTLHNRTNHTARARSS